MDTPPLSSLTETSISPSHLVGLSNLEARGLLSVDYHLALVYRDNPGWNVDHLQNEPAPYCKIHPSLPLLFSLVDYTEFKVKPGKVKSNFARPLSGAVININDWLPSRSVYKFLNRPVFCVQFFLVSGFSFTILIHEPYPFAVSGDSPSKSAVLIIRFWRQGLLRDLTREDLALLLS